MNRKVHGGASAQIAVVHIASEDVRRTAWNASHTRRRRYAHHSPKRPGRYNNAVSIVDRFLCQIDEQDPVPGIRKVFGQKPAVRRESLRGNRQPDIDRPDPHFQHVAGFGFIDVDWSS